MIRVPGIIVLVLLASPWLDRRAVATGPARRTRDVSLLPTGRLVGRVVDATGRGIGGVTVTIDRGRRRLIQVASRRDGWFAVDDLAGGIWIVTAEDRSLAVRAWAAGTAPPNSHNQLNLIAHQPVIRSQSPVLLVQNVYPPMMSPGPPMMSPGPPMMSPGPLMMSPGSLMMPPGSLMMPPGSLMQPGGFLIDPLLTASVVAGTVSVIVVATNDDDEPRPPASP